MPILKQPERGIRTEYDARYGYSAKLSKGMQDDHDPSTLPDEAVAWAENVRVHDGLLISRGGQTKANRGVYGTSALAMDGEVIGMVETDDGPLSVPPLSGSLLADLYAYWKLDDAAGADKLDYVGGFPLVEMISGGVIAQVLGKIGNATEFSVGTAFLQPKVGGTLIMPPGDFALTLWFYPKSAVGNQYLFSFGTNTLAGTVTLQIWPDFLAGLRFFTALATPAETANAPVINAWNVVNAWHDSALGMNYAQLNGGAIASAPGPNAAAAPTYTRFARHAGGGAQYVGIEDAVILWSRILTPTERAALNAV